MVYCLQGGHVHVRKVRCQGVKRTGEELYRGKMDVGFYFCWDRHVQGTNERTLVF